MSGVVAVAGTGVAAGAVIGGASGRAAASASVTAATTTAVARTTTGTGGATGGAAAAAAAIVAGNGTPARRTTLSARAAGPPGSTLRRWAVCRRRCPACLARCRCGVGQEALVGWVSGAVAGAQPEAAAVHMLAPSLCGCGRLPPSIMHGLPSCHPAQPHLPPNCQTLDRCGACQTPLSAQRPRSRRHATRGASMSEACPPVPPRRACRCF